MSIRKISENMIDDNFVGKVENLGQQLAEIVTNVKTYGAIGDGVADDTVAIQTAIDHALNNKLGELFFPSGVYNISSPLECYRNGRYIKIRGAGRRDSVIYATANMPYMLRTWADDTIFNINVKDIGFRLGIFADVGIDAFKTPYSTFDNISIFTKKTNSICMILSSWCNRLINSQLYGDFSYDGHELGIVPATALKVADHQSTNNLIIDDNVFGLIDVGIIMENYINDAHIHKNTFDHVGKVLISIAGTKNVSFKYNYLEACGGNQNVPYDIRPISYKTGAYERSLTSMFILFGAPPMNSLYKVSINIEENTFMKCRKSNLFSVSSVGHVIIDNNIFNQTDTYENIVTIFGHGINNFNSILEISHPTQVNVKTGIQYDNNYDGFYFNRGMVLLNEHMVFPTLKQRFPAILNGEDVSSVEEVIVNSNNSLRIDYRLSDFDRKHPHRIGFDVEKNNGVTVEATWNDSKVITFRKTVIDGDSNVGYITSQPEIDQESKFHINIYSSGDVKIRSVFLHTASCKGFPVQLL